jgi:O-antigen ligase
VVGALQNDRFKSLPEFFALIVFPVIVGATLTSDRRVAREFLVGLTSGTLVLCVIGLVEAGFDHVFLVSSTSVYAETFIRAGHVRATAGWAFPTEFSAFLCLTGFFVVEVFQRRWGTTGMIFGGALITAAVIATQSRSGLAGLVAGAVAYLLLQRRLGQGLRVLGALGVAVALLLVVPGAAPESFRRFVGQSLTPGSGANANVTYRQELYHDAAVAMSHHPVFGYGYGSGKSVATNSLHAYFGDLTDLASLPVSISVQLGYAGAITCALLLLGALVRLARRMDAMARLPLAAGIVGSAVAMGGVPLSSPVSVMLLLVGMAWQLTTRSPEGATLQTGHPIAAAGDAGRSGDSIVGRGHDSNSLRT